MTSAVGRIISNLIINKRHSKEFWDMDVGFEYSEQYKELKLGERAASKLICRFVEDLDVTLIFLTG